MLISIKSENNVFQNVILFISAGCNHDAKSNNNNYYYRYELALKGEKGQRVKLGRNVSNNIILLFVCKTKNGNH